ncbi:hypothetical protein HPB48_009202 [Haemaphysalis longicornis]|uniref:Uncharacterized protein n=1 Tax=Haemaphysalis longicornis TaxID=44386 RepID=A0A9J6FGW8_HAELO|nr:hypothetical protein HPB48_009202 [Haemaphysalis longicornis]
MNATCEEEILRALVLCSGNVGCDDVDAEPAGQSLSRRHPARKTGWLNRTGRVSASTMRRCENNAAVYRAIAIACCVILLVGLAWLYESCLQYSNGRHTFGQLISRQRFFLRRWQAFDNTLPDESNAIWFIESSNETYLKGRQACAVESASLHNPSLPVVLLTTGQLSPDGGYYEALQSLPNFRALRVNLTDVFNETPLDLWYQSRNWTSGPYRIEDLSDGVRLAVLVETGWNLPGPRHHRYEVLGRLEQQCHVRGDWPAHQQRTFLRQGAPIHRKGIEEVRYGVQLDPLGKLRAVTARTLILLLEQCAVWRPGEIP